MFPVISLSQLLLLRLSLLLARSHANSPSASYPAQRPRAEVIARTAAAPATFIFDIGRGGRRAMAFGVNKLVLSCPLLFRPVSSVAGRRRANTKKTSGVPGHRSVLSIRGRSGVVECALSALYLMACVGGTRAWKRSRPGRSEVRPVTRKQITLVATSAQRPAGRRPTESIAVWR